MSDNKNKQAFDEGYDAVQDGVQERITRVLMFMLISFILLRYLSGIELSDVDQIKLVLGSTICFMFISTYYPAVTVH